MRDPDDAALKARLLWDEGAVWVDVGGESTRPGSDPVTEEVELRRVLPVLEKINQLPRTTQDSQRCGHMFISIDTVKPRVAREALQLGAIVVNDVSGLAAGDAMLELLSESDCGYVLTHCQGTPKTMQVAPFYRDCVGEVLAFFERGLEILRSAGVALERVVLDPGFGFGKKWSHNRELLLSLQRFKTLGRPLLVGLSRKSFIGRITGRPPAQRLFGTLAAETLAIWHGADILRTHEAAPALEAATVAKTIRSGGIE